MKTYFTIISYIQLTLLTLGIATLIVLPSLIVFYPDVITANVSSVLYAITHTILLFVMTIRPLADIFTGQRFIRPLVQLRKGFGVVAASIVVSFLLAKIIMDPTGFLASLGTSAYWSMTKLALLAHLADITGVILLITSNNFSKHLLGAWWKRIQRLSYVFFYASGIYVVANYGDTLVINYLFIVTILTVIAWIKNQARRG
jgi:DMSO/TMAO reductase YedYZ heme-binding membrane subunit